MPEQFLVTESQMRHAVACLVKEAGSQKDWASEHCISPQLLCDVLSGNRSISDPLAQRLGFRKVSVYVPIEE